MSIQQARNKYGDIADEVVIEELTTIVQKLLLCRYINRQEMNSISNGNILVDFSYLIVRFYLQ